MVATFVGPAAVGPSYTFQEVNERPRQLSTKRSTCQAISDILARVVEDGDQFSFGALAHTVLPSLPGLSVSNIGHVALPLPIEDAPELTSQCTQVRDKVWALRPDQVQLTNPAWDKGLRLLCKLSARKLGYHDVELRPELKKLLVYGQGGGLSLEKDTLEDRVAARLVVQLPSDYTGGNLKISEEPAGARSCYDFGKENGTAVFVPYYAVYAAGAYRTVGMVTSGYRLVLVYSLCVPPTAPFALGKTISSLLQVELSEALGRLVEEQRDVDESGFAVGEDESDDSNALLAVKLTRLCTKQKFEDSGVDALTGKDRDRFRVLSASNALLSPGGQLKLYVVCYHLEVTGEHQSWTERKWRVQNALEWYKLDGTMLGTGAEFAWGRKFNFVNPDKQAETKLYEECETDAELKIDRFVLVGLPASASLRKIIAVMGSTAAMASVVSEDPINKASLLELLKYEAGHHDEHRARPMSQLESTGSQRPEAAVPIAANLQRSNATKSAISQDVCEKLAQAILEFDDATLVKVFFMNFFSMLEDKCRFVPILSELVWKFGWAVCASIMEVLNDLPPEEANLALKLAEMFQDTADAHTALTVCAVEKASAMIGATPSNLPSPGSIALLWKHAARLEKSETFATLNRLFQQVDAELLGPVVTAISECIDESSAPEHHDALGYISLRRRQWLLDEITRLNKFTWEIPVANFPDAAAIASFLGGPNVSLSIKGFRGIVDARARADLLRRKIEAPLTITAEGRGREAFVRIQKGNDDLAKRREMVPVYKLEINRLDKLLRAQKSEANEDINDENADVGNSTPSTSLIGKKRPHEDETDANTIA